MWFFIVLSFIRKRKQLWIYFVWNKIFLLSKTKRLLERIVMTTFAGRVNLLYILANWILCTWYIIRYHIVHSCYKLNYKNKYPRKYISFLSISFIYRLFLHIYINSRLHICFISSTLFNEEWQHRYTFVYQRLFCCRTAEVFFWNSFIQNKIICQWIHLLCHENVHLDPIRKMFGHQL